MKLEDIQRQWDEDSNIDRLNLGEEALKIHQYHAKYYRIYIHESLLLKKLDEELKELRFQKYEFLTLGYLSYAETPKHWELPSKGKIIKADVQPYIDSDKEVVDLTLRVGLQKEKCQFLKSIIDSLISRGYNIKAAIDFARFQAGG